MTLAELKAEAAKILAIPDVVGEFSNHSFRTRSSGCIRNELRVPEVHHSREWRYKNAYAGELVILCRDTGTKDARKRSIYVTPDGVTFVYAYRSGSPERYDDGRIVSPMMATSPNQRGMCRHGYTDMDI